ncbi:recombinase family protein [Deinococcus ruber]|uniref:Recombinase domain-containing protein n=1 Tax=Deinococcus ruber TaxID=1848197 RepID=A0A918BZI6_9DEIO|nr:recombinase family protein [Deinococcus ruber]GGR00044.1 hypothetical protein GCM10008957_10910 [Deinococcus ruber]
MTLSPALAIGGIRVSTDQQVDKYGPDRQRADIHREAERAGLDVTDWVEEAISGADDERAFENRYYQLAREHAGLNVIFSHPNRVGRHVEVTVGIARRIHGLGGTVWIAGIGSLRDRRNWKEFLRDAVDAENDYTNLVYNLETGREDKARRGLWPHGSPPWGYELERNSSGIAQLPRIVSERAAVVRRVFDLGELYGETHVLRVMQSEGWPAPTARGWSRRAVSSLLNNHHYTGVKIFRGIRVEFEPIITSEQFQRVQARRSERRTHSSAKGLEENKLLLTGHVRCAVCDGSLVRDVDVSRRKDGTHRRLVLYRCWRGKRPDGCKNKRRWKEDDLDKLAWAALTRTLTQPELLAQVVAPLPTPDEAQPLARLAELETAIERAWQPFAAGRPGYSEAMAERIAAPFIAELETLRREQRSRPEPVAPDFEARAGEFRQLLERSRSLASKRQLLHALNVRISVGPEGIEGLRIEIP